MQLLLIILIFVMSIILHEYAHGWVAEKLGDPTARQAGRLSLNPLKHIDPFGTVLVPLLLLIVRANFFFGWAKPVPVNYLNLHNPKRDMIWVGLAGPGINIFIALSFSAFLRFNPPHEITEILDIGILINLLLACFNLIPIPPLDGSRLVMGLLPEPLSEIYSRLENFGILIVLLLVYFGFFNKIILPIVITLAYYLGAQ